jgi:hypothetical protein
LLFSTGSKAATLFTQFKKKFFYLYIIIFIDYIRFRQQFFVLFQIKGFSLMNEWPSEQVFNYRKNQFPTKQIY